MTQMKPKEEQDLWENAELDHNVVQDIKQERECREFQSLEDTISVHHCKKEPEEVEIKAEPLPQFLHESVKSEEGETQPSLLLQTVTEEKRKGSDDSEDTDDSADWPSSAQRKNEELYGPAHRNNVTEGTKICRHTCLDCGNTFKTATSVVQDIKQERECREFQSLEDTISVHHCKKEPEEVEIKAEPLPQFLHESVKSEEGETQPSLLLQTVTEEKREGSDDSEDTDDSEDWPSSAQRKNEELYGPAHRNNVTKGTKICRHTCLDCGNTFKTATRLSIHQWVHTGEKPFKCTVCAKSFVEKYRLNLHLKGHMGEKPFKCTVCEKGFTTKSSLKMHLQIHTGERPYKCPICSKGFSGKHHLRTHMNYHTGARPFKCSVCTKDFTDNNLLKKHMRVHTGEKPYKCSVCSKDLAGMTSLKIHMMCHTGERPFKCSVCTKGFRQNALLTKHMRTHTGERPFKCSICSSAFKVKPSLIGHMKKHIGEGPLKCVV